MLQHHLRIKITRKAAVGEKSSTPLSRSISTKTSSNSSSNSEILVGCCRSCKSVWPMVVRMTLVEAPKLNLIIISPRTRLNNSERSPNPSAPKLWKSKTINSSRSLIILKKPHLVTISIMIQIIIISSKKQKMMMRWSSNNNCNPKMTKTMTSSNSYRTWINSTLTRWNKENSWKWWINRVRTVAENIILFSWFSPCCFSVLFQKYTLTSWMIF